MSHAVEFQGARDATLDTKLDIMATDRWPPPTSLEAVMARQALREALDAVRDLVLLLNAPAPGSGINFRLIMEIGAAEMRVAKARQTVKRIDRTNIE